MPMAHKLRTNRAEHWTPNVCAKRWCKPLHCCTPRRGYTRRIVIVVLVPELGATCGRGLVCRDTLGDTNLEGRNVGDIDLTYTYAYELSVRFHREQQTTQYNARPARAPANQEDGGRELHTSHPCGRLAWNRPIALMQRKA